MSPQSTRFSGLILSSVHASMSAISLCLMTPAPNVLNCISMPPALPDTLTRGMNVQMPSRSGF